MKCLTFNNYFTQVMNLLKKTQKFQQHSQNRLKQPGTLKLQIHIFSVGT